MNVKIQIIPIKNTDQRLNIVNVTPDLVGMF